MPWTEAPPACTWKDLREQLAEVATSDQLACRGQPMAYDQGKLYSSIDRALRLRGISGRLATAIERTVIQRFIQQAPNYLPVAEQSQLGHAPTVLMLMRHYGGPTRLLDWTESVWIAAFNACTGEWGDPGIIWAFQRQPFDAAMAQRFGAETAIASQTRDIPGLGPFPAITVLDLQPWVCRLYGTGPQNPRVIAQQSMFTVGSRLGIDHAQFIDSTLPDSRRNLKQVVRIAPDLKPQVLKELAKMGITASALYPGVDGVGMHLDNFAHFAHLEGGVTEASKGPWGEMFSPAL
jgi:hypothetical protein